MSRVSVRQNAVYALAATAGATLLAWLGLYGFAWNDYEVEARPAFEALVHGHLAAFLRLTPAYGGSLVLRAPFALLPDLWGGGELAVYRAVSIPCLLAAAALGVWLVTHMRQLGHSALARWTVLGLCAANPLALYALELGHPEELLGATLCVAAVLVASGAPSLTFTRDGSIQAPSSGWVRPVSSGLLLGLAIANKEWALLAVGPVLLALPARRILCLLVAAASTAVVLAPLALVASGGFIAATRGTAAPSSAIFEPWQLWWFMARHGPLVHGVGGEIMVGYRTAPSWVGAVSHPLVVAVELPLSALLAWRHSHSVPQRNGRTGDALLLLALLMLLRCLLDIWDVVYYMLPFLLALTAWEGLRGRGLPAFSLSAATLAWISFEWLPGHASPDVQSAFLAWTLPLLALLAARLYAPGTSYEMTVNSFGRPHSTSGPSSLTAIRSSIRTP
jgi:hypothetical protein